MNGNREERVTREMDRGPEKESGRWSRREVLSLAGSGALLPVLAACGEGLESGGREASSSREEGEVYNSSVMAHREAIRRAEISSEELVQVYLDRIEEVNPALNAVVQLRTDEALAAARRADEALARGEDLGPLHGVPMTIKDSFDTRGVISTGGTTGRREYVPEQDATVVRRLREAGAILLGKTNTPELTLSYETDNPIYGPTRNPYDLERTPGGSSGGAVAIVAAGGSPFDIGSDYGGSIRLPAHCCGITGVKPTSGRVPRSGHIMPPGGYLDSFQQIGPLARHVEDLHPLLAIIAGPDGIDPAIAPVPLGDPAAIDLSQLRIQLHTDNGIMTPTAETIEALRSAGDKLSASVATVEEGRPPGIEQTFEITTGLWNADGGAATRRLLESYGTTESRLAPDEPAAGLDAAELDALIHRWDEFRRRMLSVFETTDILLGPVNAHPAQPLGTSTSDGRFLGFSYTMTHNLTGFPGAVVRCGTSPEGLPIGIQIVAAPWREDQVLAVAARIEEELGGFVPPEADFA